MRLVYSAASPIIPCGIRMRIVLLQPNLIVVEAKKAGASETALGQLLAYMGVI
jgi:hypothetical protein